MSRVYQILNAVNEPGLAPVRSGEPLPYYSVRELNDAAGVLLQRGFAPRFLLQATVTRPVEKRGHLWLSLGDGDATINGVIWASSRKRLRYEPEDGDGVTIVGKLNFWTARAQLSVQVIDIRPSLAVTLRRFEVVRRRLEAEGLLDAAHKRPLPFAPGTVAVLTSVPSSALADMQRTAQERWPACRWLLVPIPVQGQVEASILQAFRCVAQQADILGLDAAVIARGGGSREDLAVFDSEAVARAIAACPVPVVSGIGHEDDTTVADLVADHRAATPTAAMVALLPDRHLQRRELAGLRQLLRALTQQRLETEAQQLQQRRRQAQSAVLQQLTAKNEALHHGQRLLVALGPRQTLRRGFALLRRGDGSWLRSIRNVVPGERLEAELADGTLVLSVETKAVVADNGSGALPS